MHKTKKKTQNAVSLLHISSNASANGSLSLTITIIIISSSYFARISLGLLVHSRESVFMWSRVRERKR